MTRAYTVKGKKRKNKDAATKHDHEQEEEQQIQPTPKKPNRQNEEQSEPIATTTEESELPGIPITPLNEKNSDKQGVIFILEKASLEVAKVGKVLWFLFC